MKELNELRQEIDLIDSQLLPLFLKRMEICSEVADYKRAAGMPILDPKREQQVLDNKLRLLNEAGMESEVYEFFNAIMAISRVRQARELSNPRRSTQIENIIEKSAEPIKEPRICYFGSEGAYSEEAAIKCFGENAERFCANTFEDAFITLKEKKADYLVLPIENSSTGTIAGVMNLMELYGFYIVGEVYVPIHHCLMGIKGAKLSDIRTIYSHEQGILQSGAFLKTLSNVRCETYYSTALSAKAVAECGDKSMAAIAGKRNAEIYGLEILAENINNNAANTTRFAVVAERPEIHKDCNKISVAFTLPHESGSLHHLLAAFASGGLNLMKLESRPIPSKRFEYMFFADYAGNLLDSHVREVTDSVIEGAGEFKFIGNYKGGNMEETE